jgi:hypothetical protein
MQYGDLDRAPNDLQGALARAQVIQAVASPTRSVATIQAVAAGNFSASELAVSTIGVRVYDPTDICPAWALVFIAGGTFSYLFIAGAANQAQGSAIWAGYTSNILGGQLLNGDDNNNPWYAQAWASIQAIILADTTITAKLNGRMIFSGHSAGGPIAAYGYVYNLGQYRQALYPSYLVTIGAPSWGTPSIYQQLLPYATSAWFLSNDPVPIVPPPLTFAQRWWAGLTYGQANRLSRFSYWPGGVQIDLSNVVTTQVSPTQIGPDPVGSVQSWLSLTASGVQTSHSIATYIARMTAALPPPPALIPTPLPPLPVPPAQQVTTAQITATVNAAVQTSFQRSDLQNADPVIIPLPELFAVTRVGRVYYVTFGGQVVATGPHRRGAHQLAREGNAFLRSMQSRAGVDTAEMAGQFSAYLDAATDPTQGFQPVMIDGL